MPDEVPLPRIPRSREDDHAEPIVAMRRELARRVAGRALEHIAGRPVPPEAARGNCENVIGFAQVPIGLAGPLRVETSAGLRELYVPMATNEGALVASHSRGMRLIASGGAARARVLREGLTQNPVLSYASAADAERAAELVERSFDELARIVSGTTRHGRLVSASPEVIGRRLLVALRFTTGDAVGINMAARASELVAAWIAERTAAVARALHGQDVEKRANARAMIEGRGRSVVAEVTVPRAALAGLARTTPESLIELWHTYQVGFAQLQTHNWCVQSANGLAAVMLACGQDVAYLPECATGLLDFDLDAKGDLYASVSLPSLLVGTIGGGTQKGTAVESLAILGCAGAGHANTFAEILAAVVLAGDLSLMAAFASHEFVDAHEALGRNRPERP